MTYRPVQPSSRRRLKAYLPALALVAVLIAGAMLAKSRCQPKVPPVASEPAETPVASWRIEVNSNGPQRFGGQFAPGRLLFVPAGADFHVSPVPSAARGMFVAASSSGIWDHEGGELNPPTQTAGGWRQSCRAPAAPGLYRLSWLPTSRALPGHATAVAAAPQSALGAEPSPGSLRGNNPQLDVLVLTHAEFQQQNGRTAVKVNGKPIGAYLEPSQSSVRRVRENSGLYQPPHFFAILTPETIPLGLGPDFDLGQLVAFKDYHTSDGHKVYTTERHTNVLALRPELIDKLAKLRERLRAKGIKVTRFWLTSAFRTPEYNHSIGGAAYSRHCYGDAVDLVIDEDGDKRMDDLNGDGRIDRKDGILIGNACRELELEGAVVPGGIGVYEWDSDDSVRCHVHIDCRGYISRWGQVGMGKHKKTFTWWPQAEFQEEESGE